MYLLYEYIIMSVLLFSMQLFKSIVQCVIKLLTILGGFVCIYCVNSEEEHLGQR